jgi:hypothetical protein
MSPTIDEVGFMAAGLSHWQTGRFHAYAANPPLVRLWATLPVLALRPVTNWERMTGSVSSREEMIFGEEFIKKNRDRYREFFLIARLACIGFTIAGAVWIRSWASQLYGKEAGNSAAALWCFSPMVLGHGSLIATDVAAGIFGFLAFRSLRAWIHRRTFASTTLMGIAVGLALGTKFTWIPIILPLFLLLWILARWQMRDSCQYWRLDAAHLFLAIVVSLVVLNGLYGFEDSGMPLGQIPFVSRNLMDFQANREANRFSGTLVGNIPVPLPKTLLQGVDFQKHDFEHMGYARSYLCGNWQNGGWWYYYVVGVAVKTPIGTLLIAIVGLICYIRRIIGDRASRRCRPSIGWNRANKLSPWLESLFLLAPATALFLLVSLERGFNAHFRYVLPAFPFACVLLSRVAAVENGAIKKLVRLCLLLQLASVFAWGPFWIGYFNELVGGPKHGGKWMLGSSVDWGQDLYELRCWQDLHPESCPIRVDLCTSCDLESLGIIFNGRPTEKDLQDMRSGWYAISVNRLRGQDISGMPSDVYSPFLNRSPDAWIGYSICIFHLK